METSNLFAYFDLLAQVRKHYANALAPLCRDWKLTKNELDVMLFLYNNPGFDRAADIVQRRGIAKSHVSLSVSALDTRGFLRRSLAQGDRRTVRLKLTETGMAVAAQGRQIQEEFFSRLFEGITREELELWQRLTERVRENAGHL